MKRKKHRIHTSIQKVETIDSLRIQHLFGSPDDYDDYVGINKIAPTGILVNRHSQRESSGILVDRHSQREYYLA